VNSNYSIMTLSERHVKGLFVVKNVDMPISSNYSIINMIRYHMFELFTLR